MHSIDCIAEKELYVHLEEQQRPKGLLVLPIRGAAIILCIIRALRLHSENY